MAPLAKQPDAARMRWIEDAVRRAESRVRRLRLTNRTALILGLIASGVATVSAAIVAKNGALGPLAWSEACWLVAGFTAITTLTSGLQTGLDLPANLVKTSSCLGRLRALELAAAVGTRPVAEISKECEEIAREYPDVLV
jgi:hypothetical protein